MFCKTEGGFMDKNDNLMIESMAAQIVLNYLISVIEPEKQLELKQILDSLAIRPSLSPRESEFEGKIIARAQELVDCGIASGKV